MSTYKVDISNNNPRCVSLCKVDDSTNGTVVFACELIATHASAHQQTLEHKADGKAAVRITWERDSQ